MKDPLCTLKEALYLSVCCSEVGQSQTPAIWITGCLYVQHISLAKKKKKKSCYVYLFIFFFFFSLVEQIVVSIYTRKLYISWEKQLLYELRRREMQLYSCLERWSILIGGNFLLSKRVLYFFISLTS